MKLADFTRSVPLEAGAKKNQDEDRELLRAAVYEELSPERLHTLSALERNAARKELAAALDQIINKRGMQTGAPSERARLIEDTLDMVLGLGPIERLLKDASVTEIMVNGHSSVYFERDGKLYPDVRTFASEEQLRAVVDRIVSPLGRRVDEQSPIVNARLPQGHRVNVVIPPLAVDGTTVTIRKFRSKSFTLQELVKMHSMSQEIAELLAWAVRARKNIAVSGGTGGGKTTLLGALSRQIPHDERVVTIEDSAELRFDSHPHVVRMEARVANAEGKGEVTIRDLVTNSLRMRPDRIIVGECRGAEALDMLQAMNTGHDGSMTTLHANSPAEVVPRLVMMVRYGMDLPTKIIESQVQSALDVIVQQDRMSGGVRRVSQVVAMEVRGLEGNECQEADFSPVVQWDRRTRRYVWKAVPVWVDELPYLEVATQEEVNAWEQRLCCA